MGKRADNERKFPNWEDLPDGGRRYSLQVPGRLGWRACYIKIVDANENTISFYQEIYDPEGELVEIHEKFPVDRGHRRVKGE